MVIVIFIDANRSQMIYEKTGHYERNFEEVFQATYNSSEFMDSYHWGVYTTFAWMHHLEFTIL